VLTDSAGGPGLARACRARNIGFATVARTTAQITAAIDRARWNSGRWQPAVRQDGEPRKGAEVAELTDLVDLSAWPPGTRLLVRSEPLHPGAQQTLFDHHRYQFWGHYTDAPGDPVDLDAHMRAHAHVEDHIKRLKDSGGQRFPFTANAANAAWLAIVCLAEALVRWFQRLCLTGPPRQGRAQSPALGALAHPRPPRRPCPHPHRPHHRRLARRRHLARGLRPHRRHLLTGPSSRPASPPGRTRPLRRAPPAPPGPATRTQR
jgi:hypothetical protein